MLVYVSTPSSCTSDVLDQFRKRIISLYSVSENEWCRVWYEVLFIEYALSNMTSEVAYGKPQVYDILQVHSPPRYYFFSHDE